MKITKNILLNFLKLKSHKKTKKKKMKRYLTSFFYIFGVGLIFMIVRWITRRNTEIRRRRENNQIPLLIENNPIQEANRENERTNHFIQDKMITIIANKVK